MNAIGGRVARRVALENLRICGPVKRSKAREPVRCASTPAPPTAALISRALVAVLESIQIGRPVRDRSGTI